MKNYQVMRKRVKKGVLIVLAVLMPSVIFCNFSGLNFSDSHQDTVTVSFSSDIAPVIESKCIECHAPGRTPPFLVRDRYYQTLRKRKYTTPSKAHKSPLYNALKEDHAGLELTPGELALFKGWIDQGAAKN